MSDLINTTQLLADAELKGYANAQMFNLQTYYIIVIVITLTIVMAILWIYFYTDSKKTRFLRFYNSSQAGIIKGNIDNQKFISKNKAWHIDKAKPIFLKTPFGFRPLYLIKDNSAIAWEFDNKRKMTMSSESLKNFCDHDNIKQLMKLTSAENKDKILFLILGMVAGVVAGMIIRGLL